MGWVTCFLYIHFARFLAAQNFPLYSKLPLTLATVSFTVQSLFSLAVFGLKILCQHIASFSLSGTRCYESIHLFRVR